MLVLLYQTFFFSDIHTPHDESFGAISEAEFSHSVFRKPSGASILPGTPLNVNGIRLSDISTAAHSVAQRTFARVVVNPDINLDGSTCHKIDLASQPREVHWKYDSVRFHPLTERLSILVRVSAGRNANNAVPSSLAKVDKSTPQASVKCQRFVEIDCYSHRASRYGYPLLKPVNDTLR